MESEAELEDGFTPRLPLLLNPAAYVQSPQRSGMLTPPLYSAAAAVPFRWEEEPGKPRDSTGSTQIEFSPKCLELPPRMFSDVNNVSKRTSSPTTVLDGPYMGMSSRFQSFSFRMITRGESHGSFRRRCNPDDERGQLSALVVSKRGIKDGGFLGSWRWGRIKGFKGKREVGGASYVFPSSAMDKEAEGSIQAEEERSSNNVTITRITRSGSYSFRDRSQFWATIREGLKQVVPWSRRKLKKEKFVI